MSNRKSACFWLFVTLLLAMSPGRVGAQSPPAGPNLSATQPASIALPPAQGNASEMGASALEAPSVNVPARAAKQFERNPFLSLPKVLIDQWKPGSESPAFEEYSHPAGAQTHRLNLKQTIYVALRNNPGLAAVALDPMAATESVDGANAAFDPLLSSQIDVDKQVSPVNSPFQNPGTVADAVKYYDWNFGISKVLPVSNGTFGLIFENDRTETNSSFSAVNPMYTPLLSMSLSQPLLQNFGWQFATINVRLAESAQRSAQWNYGSSLNDFVQHIGNDYWGVVQAQENLRVAQSALAFDNELLRVNNANYQVGMMAPVDVAQARSAAATARANVAAAQAALDIALATLRQDVAFRPGQSFFGEEIEPVQEPSVVLETIEPDKISLDKMLEFSPALAGLREAITSAMLQVKYAENQTLPQLNLGTQFSLTSEAGNANCTASFSVPAYANCFNPSGPKVLPGKNNAAELPFSGEYSDALNRLFDTKFYSYAALLSFSMPLDNAAAKAALAQAKIAYNQARLQYREAVYQAALQVKSALVNLKAYQEQVEATNEATKYAAESLHDVSKQFEVGTATTNQVLQYQSNLVTAQGNQVQADVGLENARLSLMHAEGTLLKKFNIEFHPQPQASAPWYARIF
ncbi:MAG: TolC family protein [Candidatus Binataceae bacterium]